jgi:hypothetical protein
MRDVEKRSRYFKWHGMVVYMLQYAMLRVSIGGLGDVHCVKTVRKKLIDILFEQTVLGVISETSHLRYNMSPKPESRVPNVRRKKYKSNVISGQRTECKCLCRPVVISA